MSRSVRNRVTFGVVGVLSLAGFGLGCTGKIAQAVFYPHSRTETLSQRPDEHANSIREVMERDRKALMEDLDILFMTDRPTRLTRWQDR